jgi:histidinol-phosphate aminotransferase
MGGARAINRALAERHYIRGEQIVLGQRRRRAVADGRLPALDQGSELLSPWPSYSLYPTIATRAGARFVEAELADGFVDPAALLAQVGDRTRMIVISNPNDPTGTYIESGQVGELLSRLPEHTYLALDEAYVHFQDAEDEDACMRLVEAFPRLLVSSHVLEGVRALRGARGVTWWERPQPRRSSPRSAPMLGVNALTQAAVLQALKIGDRDLQRLRATVIEQRQPLCARRSRTCRSRCRKARQTRVAACRGDQRRRAREAARAVPREVAPGGNARRRALRPGRRFATPTRRTD